MRKLSPIETSLLAFMANTGYDTDVPISDMYAQARGTTAGHIPSAQRYLGAFISRINRASEGEKIVPGALKHTYRLVRI